MSTLQGRSIATTYKDLLQVSNNNIGVDGTIRAVEDGEGTQSALALSTDTIEIRGPIIPSTNATFDIGSAERKIRHLYLSSNSLYVGDLQFSEQDLQEVKNVRGGAYATSAQGALAETALQPGAFSFGDLSSKPTTLAGYGIIDAATAAQGDAADAALAKANTALQPGGVRFTNDVTDKPTTLAGYGITDAFDGNFSSLQGTPTSLAGYGITDAATATQGDKADSALQPGDNIAFSNVTNTPTSLAGYGITDAATSAQGSLADTALQPGDSVSFSNITNTPVTLAGYGITNAATSTQGDKADTALQPDTEIHVNTVHLSGGKIFGPATMYIDPEAIGDNTGKLVILGDLQVDGVTTTVNSTTVSVSDKNFEIAKGATTSAQADGAGLLINPDISMLYQAITDSINFNKTLTTNGDIRINDQTSGATRKIVFDMTNTGGAQTDLSIQANNGNLSFYSEAQAAEYMRINSSGNVGIGVTAPTYKLDVAGDINMTGALKVNGQDAVFSNWTNQNDGSISRASDVSVTGDVDVSGTMGVGEVFVMDNDGTLGGATPTTVGQVVTWDGAKWIAADNVGGGGSSGPSEVPAAFSAALTQGQSVHTINFAKTYDTIPAVVTDLQITGDGDIIPYVITAVTTSNMTVTFASAIPNNNYKLNIAFGGRDVFWNAGNLNTINYTDGNVGIGTTNPSDKLAVLGNSTNFGISITNGNNPARVTLVNNEGNATIDANNGLLRLGNFTSGDLVIDSTGNVGIGTTNPSTALDVLGSNQGVALFKSQSTTEGATTTIAIESPSATSNGRTRVGADVDDLFFSTSNGASDPNSSVERMRIDTAGNVGIGTTSPGEILHVEKSSGTTLVKTEVATNSVVGFDIKKTGATNQEWRIVDGQTINGRLEIYDVTDSRSVMAFDGDGNVGIGTTSPSSLLHVAPKNNVDPDGFTTNESYFKVFDNATSGLGQGRNGGVVYIDANYYTGESDVLHVLGRGVSKLLVKGNGNVGIGTTSPDALLDVEGSLDQLNSATIKNTSSTGYGLMTMGGGNGATRYVADFRDKDGTSCLKIDGNGNVGIGTGSPDATLHISSPQPVIRLTDTTPATDTVSQVWADSDTVGALMLASDITNVGTDPFISLRIGGLGEASEKMRIKGNGNVGIGTKSPVHRLEVAIPNSKYCIHAVDENDLVSLGGLFRAEAGEGGGLELYLKQPGETKIRLSSNSSRSTYFNAGNVGIGTTDPQRKLSVVQSGGTWISEFNSSSTTPYGLNLLFSGSSSTTTTFFQCSNSTAVQFRIVGNGNVQNFNNSYGQLSDIKLKENVVKASPKLDDLKKIRVVNFNFKGDDLKQIGVVAQELEEIFPGLVDDVPDHDEDGNLLETTTKLVKYSVFGPILIKAIQEQQTMIDELKAQNESLINRIETLENNS